MREFTKIERDNLLDKQVRVVFHDESYVEGLVSALGINAIIIRFEDGGGQLYPVTKIERIDILSDPDFEAQHTCVPQNYETNDNMVSHPPHYQSATGLEVIDVIEAFTADLIGIEAADTANVIKYICRWNSKNGLQDLKKAMWYLTHLINHVEKSEKEND